MPRTPLFAVARQCIHPQISGEYEMRYMVYKPITNPQGITWTKNVSKASRWQNPADARHYLSEAIREYEIPYSQLSVMEV